MKRYLNQLLLLGAAAIVLPLLLYPRNVALTYLLLVGIWIVELTIKRLHQLDNITALADLSFASLVFSIGRGASLINIEGVIDFDPTVALYLVLTVAILLYLWLANLENCRNYREIKKEDLKKVKEKVIWKLTHEHAFWGLSAVYAVFSVSAVLIPQITGVI